MTETELISSISFGVGFAVSLASFVIPSFKQFLEMLDGDEKRAFFALCGAITAVIAGLIACTVGGYTCSADGMLSLILAAAASLGGSQGAYTLVMALSKRAQSAPPVQ